MESTLPHPHTPKIQVKIITNQIYFSCHSNYMHFDIQMTLPLILYAEEYNFGTATYYNIPYKGHA
jgi:hypothetical protein